MQHDNGPGLYSAVVQLSTSLSTGDWKVLNVLHRVASQVGALDIGYRAGIGDMSHTKLLFLLGAVGVHV